MGIEVTGRWQWVWQIYRLSFFVNGRVLIRDSDEGQGGDMPVVAFLGCFYLFFRTSSFVP